MFPIKIEEADFHPLTTAKAPENPQSIQIVDPEFSSVCPISGLPDYGRIILRYHPDQVIVELKDFKLHCRSYYGVGIMHEAVTDRLMQEFVKAVNPLYAQLVIDWGARGGLKTVTGVKFSRTLGYQHLDFNHGIFIKAAESWTNE